MIEVDTEDLLVERRPGAGNHKLSLLSRIWVEWGSKADWDALCELHYKGHTLAAGSRYMRCVLEREDGTPELIGVMVFANPRPLDGGRNEVFPHLKPNVNGRDNRLINQARLRWINTHMTWNNRTVLDTMYRSAGIAYRFKNLAYRMYAGRYNLPYIESRSSMGRFNPFSIKAGMKFVKPKPAAALEPGLAFFRGNFEASPNDIVAIQQELESKSPAQRALLERKLREFYYRWSSVEKSGDKRDLGMSRVNELPIDYVLKQTMQLVFSATVYWIWIAPDVERDARGQITRCLPMPERMPLLTFDAQGPNEPLRWARGGPVSPSKPYLMGEQRSIDYVLPRAVAEKVRACAG